MASHRRLLLAAAALPVAVLGALMALPLLVLATGSGATPSAVTSSGIPARVLRAYQAVDGWCTGLRWQLVAGIGYVESGHGTTGGAAAYAVSGEVTPWIFGPPLDGSAGVERLPVGTWLDWFGLTGPWQQAVGPLQFLPGTFTEWAVDQDGDGAANPHDIDDAAATAANYLCGGRTGTVRDEHAALLRYNHDEGYASRVLAFADGLAASGEISIVCPVAGPTSFSDTWLAPRPGGRQHKGVDMFATEGTPVVAPVDGDIELGHDTLGGLVFRLWGDDGNFYYGAHLSAWADVSDHIPAGTVVGYVGQTGDAAATSPHLHFEIHVGRSRGDPPSPIDPTHAAAIACGK